jgi:hypothetical protein
MLDALLADNTLLWVSPLLTLAIGSAVLTRHIRDPRPAEGELAAIVEEALDSLASGVTAEVTAQQVTAQLTALTARVWGGDRLPVTEVTARGDRVHPEG